MITMVYISVVDAVRVSLGPRLSPGGFAEFVYRPALNIVPSSSVSARLALPAPPRSLFDRRARHQLIRGPESQALSRPSCLLYIYTGQKNKNIHRVKKKTN